jgi:hypothetical protein
MNLKLDRWELRDNISTMVWDAKIREDILHSIANLLGSNKIMETFLMRLSPVPSESKIKGLAYKSPDYIHVSSYTNCFQPPRPASKWHSIAQLSA